MYLFFLLLLMVLTSVPNDLFWTILMINFLASSIICTSIKSSFDLNNIINAACIAHFIFTQLETHDSKIDKISCFWPTIQTTATLLISGSLLESTSGIFAEGGHSCVSFQKKTWAIEPLVNFMSLVSNSPPWCMVSWIIFRCYILPLTHASACTLMIRILFVTNTLNLFDSFCRHPSTIWLSVQKYSLSMLYWSSSWKSFEIFTYSNEQLPPNKEKRHT